MLTKLIKKIFLVREIRSKTGKLHFRRWRLLNVGLFSVLIHEIRRSDEDKHCHDHPYSFLSFILFGGYVEYNEKNESKRYAAGDLNYKKFTEFHQIDLIWKPTITLVITGPRNRIWGYYVDGDWVDNMSYRHRKDSGEFDIL